MSQVKRDEVMLMRWAGGNVATARFRELVAGSMPAGATILHAGCGWDKKEITAPLRTTTQIVGIDLDRSALVRYHSPRALGTLNALPFVESFADVIVCEYVVEHLDNPQLVFSEFARVLRPGGRLFLLTPNVFSYKSLVAAVTPHLFHEFVGRIRYGAGHEGDMYPTLYRCNTTRRVRQCLDAAGLQCQRISLVNNGPTWFTKFPGLFALGNFFHKIMDLSTFEILRCAMIVEAIKVE